MTMTTPIRPSNVVDFDASKPMWLVVREKCRGCNFTAVGVVHKRSDFDAQVCNRCGQASSVVTHFLKDQGPDGLSEHRRVVQAAVEPEWIERKVPELPAP